MSARALHYLRLRPSLTGGQVKAIVLALSVLVHALVLGLWAVRTLTLPPVPLSQPTLYLDIMPRAPVSDLVERETLTPPADARSAAVSRNEAAPEVGTIFEERAPALPTETLPPPEQTRPPVATADRDARIRWGLNNRMNCNLPAAQQTTEQREACAAWLGRDRDQATVITGSGNAARDAAFAEQGARNLARHEAMRAAPAGSVGVSGASPDCVGGNLRGTCAGAYLRDSFQRPEENFRSGGRSAPQ
ncbi:MAG: hypothetical protein ACK4E3_11825 [Brevundimonas sp.]|jgi:hypothetical protein|uniref:hypothetical protein n=1 Tax=Brevundimonas sp. TaxID=1871086 RepID=UPI00391B6597